MTTKNIPRTGSTTKDVPGAEDAQSEQDTVQYSLRRKRTSSSSKPTGKKGKGTLNMPEKNDIARIGKMVAIWAIEGSNVVVGRGVVDSNRRNLHGKAIGKDMAVVQLLSVEVPHRSYKLPYPNMEDDPPQVMLGDANGSAVLWRKEFVTPE